MKYKESIRLRLDDKDVNFALKESAVLRIFEQIADSQAEELGFDGAVLGREGKAWIINRIVLEMFKTYKDIKAVDAITYPRESKGIEFPRDFAITKVGGGLIARGTSMWSVIDIAKRQLSTASDLTGYIEACESVSMLDTDYRKVRADRQCDSLDLLRNKTEIMRMDADCLGHLHNVRYVEFCINALTVEEYTRGIASLNITFIKEALIGDIIEIYAKYLDENTIFIQGKVVKASGESYFAFACNIVLK